MEMITGGKPDASSRQAAQAAQEEAIRRSLQKIKNKFIVMSGKGGVGKTSVSVNLAMALAGKGYKVGIMDVDIHGPDIPRMLGISDQMISMSEEQKLVPLRFSDNLSAVSIESISADKDTAIIWRGPVKHTVIRQFIADVDWGELDYLIIDAPPGTGDEPLSVAQMIAGAQAIIVTTPQEVALADVRKSINFCRTIKMDIFGLVENMSGFTCPHCGEGIDVFGTGGGERTAKDFELPFLGRIPFDPNVVSCGDSGTCLREAFRNTPVSQAFDGIAASVIGKTAGGSL